MSSHRPPSVLANTIEAIVRLQLFVTGLPFPPSLPRPRPVLEGTWCLTSTETTRLVRDGEKREGGMEVGEEGNYNSAAIEILLLSLHSPPE